MVPKPALCQCASCGHLACRLRALALGAATGLSKAFACASAPRHLGIPGLPAGHFAARRPPSGALNLLSGQLVLCLTGENIL